MTGKKSEPKGRLSLNDIVLGEEFKPREFTITRADIDRHCWANDDYNPWYTDGSPWGTCIASPTSSAVVEHAHLQMSKHYNIDIEGEAQSTVSGMLHAKQEYEFFNPIKIGKKFRMKGRPIEKYSKRGKYYVVCEHVVEDEDRLMIMKIKSTVAWSIIHTTDEKTSSRDK